jgi:hypothetical protein
MRKIGGVLAVVVALEAKVIEKDLKPANWGRCHPRR